MILIRAGSIASRFLWLDGDDKRGNETTPVLSKFEFPGKTRDQALCLRANSTQTIYIIHKKLITKHFCKIRARIVKKFGNIELVAADCLFKAILIVNVHIDRGVVQRVSHAPYFAFQGMTQQHTAGNLP